MVNCYLQSLATHNVSAEITWRNISGNNYEVTIVTYTRISSPVSPPGLEIFWGDGTSDTIIQVNGNGVPVALDLKKNIYTGTHLYPGPGTYILSMQDLNRDAGIINIPNSVNIPMYVQSELKILPGVINNHSPEFIAMPSYEALANDKYTGNVTVYDEDGDCIKYELVPCMMDVNTNIPAYFFPPAANSFGIDSINGEMVWDYATLQGKYSFAVKVSEWRNGIELGYVMRDFEINAYQVPGFYHAFSGLNLWQTDANGNYAYTRQAGDSIELNLSYTDSANSVFDLNAYSETFIVSDTAIFSKTVTGNTINAFYKWNPDVSNVRSSPYVVTFRGESATAQGTIRSDVTLLIYVWDANTLPCSFVTGLDEPNTSENIQWYFNPVTNNFSIELPCDWIGSVFKMYNATGQLILQKRFISTNQLNIDASAMADGIYIAEIKNKTGKPLRSKLVKSN